MNKIKLSIKLRQWLNVLKIALALLIGFTGGIIYGIRSILPIWLGNEKAHSEAVSKLYTERGDEKKAEVVKTNYIKFKEVISNNILTSGIEPK